MCMVSLVYQGAAAAPDKWTPQAYEDLKVLIEVAKRLDWRLGQPDCVDPLKEGVIARIEQRLASFPAAAIPPR